MQRHSKVWYWAAFGLVVAAMVYYAHERNLYGRYIEYRQSQQTVKDRQAELDRLEQREKHLVRHVERLNNDPLEMEASIRESKHLIREGERVFRVEITDGDDGR